MQRRALVVDDENFTAALVRDTLVAAGFEVCLAHTPAEASSAFADFDPDVAVIDISLGRGVTGIDLVYLAAESYPATALLLLSRYPDLRTAGVNPNDLPPSCGFLSKSEVVQSSDLLDAVESVLRDASPRPRPSQASAGPLASLTRTQLEVLQLVAQGFTNSEIARRRCCSGSAVEKILTTIYQRLDIAADGRIHPRSEAIRIYVAAAVLPDRTQRD